MVKDQLAVLEQFPPIHPKRRAYEDSLNEGTLYICGYVYARMARVYVRRAGAPGETGTAFREEDRGIPRTSRVESKHRRRCPLDGVQHRRYLFLCILLFDGSTLCASLCVCVLI